VYRMSPSSSLGPGTGLIEMNPGMGEYVRTENYFLTPAGSEGIRGLGCFCGFSGCNCGLGQTEPVEGLPTGILGTSLFQSSDMSTWGAGEWAAIILGGYVVISVFSTTKRTARAVHRKGKAVRKALAA